MEGKLFTLVEFKFIRDVYSLNEKLFCYFQGLSTSWQPEIGDWIALFKVGWSNLKEQKVRKLITSEWLENRKSVHAEYTHVVFEPTELPKELNGLYQFVYVGKNDVVKGVSKPFHFEGTLPGVELRRLIDQMTVKPEFEVQIPRLVERAISMPERIESDLMKECQRLSLNWGKINDEAVVGKLIQKYLSNIRSMKDDEVTRKVEDLFAENGKLCMSLKTRIQEVAELKKECDEVKTINTDLLGKLGVAERKVEQLERERELNIKRIEELIKKELPVEYEQIPGRSLPFEVMSFETPIGIVEQEIDEFSRLLHKEKIQPEIRRISTYYQECLPTELRSIPEQKKRVGQIEKVLREVEGSTSQDVRLLKRLIEDLKVDNELLRERVRQMEVETVRPEVHLPVETKKMTILSPMGMELHGEKHSLPCGEKSLKPTTITTLPTTIKVSTIVPEVHTTKPTIPVKIEEHPIVQQHLLPQQPHSLQQQHPIVQQQQQQQQREYLSEQIKNKLKDRMRIQEQWHGKLNEMSEMHKELLRQTKPTPQAWSMDGDLLTKKWCLEEPRKMREQLTTGSIPTMTQMCPVCGIAMPKEINVCDFEIHVNSHFTD